MRRLKRGEGELKNQGKEEFQHGRRQRQRSSEKFMVREYLGGLVKGTKKKKERIKVPTIKSPVKMSRSRTVGKAKESGEGSETKLSSRDAKCVFKGRLTRENVKSTLEGGPTQN